MKKLFLFTLVIFITCLLQVKAQIPDDTDGRLYRLCKTWGYFKYFSQHKCELKWDTLLNTTVNQVLAANSNEEFNNALMTMFNKVGNNVNLGTQYPEPDTNINFDNAWIDDPVFSQPVQDFLETFSTYIYPDTSTCLVLFNIGSHPGYYSYIDFYNDIPSMFIDMSDEANRLTYMFFYWNVVNYFFPFRNIMDQSWDSTLYQFIPRFRQVTTIPEFHITFLQLVTKINDTHGFTTSTVLSSFFWGGSYMPKVYFTRVDTNCVVTKVDGIPGVSPGDILTALKGIPIKELEDSLTSYIPASTPAALYRDMYDNMLRGGINSSCEMTLTDINNNAYITTAIRSMSRNAWYTWKNDNGHIIPYFLTSCDYGYVDIGLLMPEQVPAMYETLKDAPAIIFDIRNYPNETLWDIGPLLFPAPIVSAVYYDPALTWLSAPYYYYLPGWYYEQNDYYNLGSWSNSNAYAGNVYILVNQETQSQAEYTCQYFSYHPNARVFGTQTAGADGNISYMNLPGGITTYFTSLGWYYADGYQQQRNGVKIDTIVSPTIAGIRQGRDEILEAALDCLTDVEELSAKGEGLSVYPNPFHDKLKYELTGTDDNQVILFEITDIYGRTVARFNKYTLQGELDFSHVTSGAYIVKITTNDEVLTKIVVRN